MCKFLKKLSFSLLGGAFILVSSVGSIAYATEADNEAVYPGGDIMDEKPHEIHAGRYNESRREGLIET